MVSQAVELVLMPRYMYKGTAFRRMKKRCLPSLRMSLWVYRLYRCAMIRVLLVVEILKVMSYSKT